MLFAYEMIYHLFKDFNLLYQRIVSHIYIPNKEKVKKP